MIKTTITVAACVTILWAGAVFAQPTSQQLCDFARITAAKKYISCVEGVVAKDAKGIAFDEFAAFARCRHTYFKKWTSFQTKASLAGSTCIGSRFADNGDQTVTDNLSGLVWENNNNGGRTWSTGAPYAENGTAFTNFLATLNSGGGFAGANGWRLPTLAELQTVVLDFACRGGEFGPSCSCPSSPCVDPALGSTVASTYWSATSYVPNPSGAWSVYFNFGDVNVYPKVQNFGVRAVRGGL